MQQQPHTNNVHPTHLLSLPIHVVHGITHHLDPASLATLKTVCHSFAHIVNTTDAWQHLFTQHWRHAPGITSYQAALATKMNTALHWRTGRTCGDLLYGHRSGVRSVCVLDHHHLVSGSKDSTVRLWDLQRGTLIASSPPHNGMVRSVAACAGMIVSAASDGRVRMWSDVARLHQRPTMLPHLHGGPVSCVALNDAVVATGSWDSTVRMWRRSGECVRTLGCADWVSQVLLRGTRLHVRAGTRVYSTDIETGTALRVTDNSGEPFTAAEASYVGHVLFTAAGEHVAAHDMRTNAKGRVLLQARTPVSSLAWEYPWLAVGHVDGSVAMVDTASSHVRGGFWCGGGGAASLDLCDGWLALAGQANNVIRTWRVLPGGRSVQARRCGERVPTQPRSRMALTTSG